MKIYICRINIGSEYFITYVANKIQLMDFVSNIKLHKNIFRELKKELWFNIYDDVERRGKYEINDPATNSRVIIEKMAF